jgi:hypothetical protein
MMHGEQNVKKVGFLGFHPSPVTITTTLSLVITKNETRERGKLPLK